MKWQGLFLLLCVLAFQSGVASPVRAGEVTQADMGFVTKVKSIKELRESRVVLQQYDFSCGSAALATILTYSYNMPTTEQQAFKKMFAVGDQPHIRKVGFSLLDMKKYLATRGIHADGYKVSLARLHDLRMPAILMISPGGYNHFVVLRGWNGASIILADPHRGLMRVDLGTFEKEWNGIVFIISDYVTRAQSHYNDAADLKILPRAPMQAGSQDNLTGFFLNMPGINEF